MDAKPDTYAITTAGQVDGPGQRRDETIDRLTRENADLRTKLSEAERLLAEARAELKQCANNLLAAESQARRDYQALLDAHYHDERDLAAVIEAISQSRLSAKETGRG